MVEKKHGCKDPTNRGGITSSAKHTSFLLLEALYERSYGAVSFVREISGGETSRDSYCMYDKKDILKD